MSHFYDSLHPDDVPPRHQGEPMLDDLDSTDEPAETGDDDANQRTD